MTRQKCLLLALVVAVHAACAWETEIAALRARTKKNQPFFDGSKRFDGAALPSASPQGAKIREEEELDLATFGVHDQQATPCLMHRTFELGNATQQLGFHQLVGSFTANALFDTNTFEDSAHTVQGVKRQQVSVGSFVQYVRAQEDAQPLEIFHDFSDTTSAHMAHLMSLYRVPAIFKRDLFSTIPARLRMPHRWLLASPAHSGSVVHIDPLGSSAWNCVLEGTKLWALFPPGTPREQVEGRHILEQHGGPQDTKSPMQRWWASVLPTLRHIEGAHEFTLEAGSCVFVPRGWWHAVYNIVPTVALTENFATWASLHTVWTKARESRPDMLASGWLLELASANSCALTEVRVKDTVMTFMGDVMQMEAHLVSEAPPEGYVSSVAWFDELVHSEEYAVLFTQEIFQHSASQLMLGLRTNLAELLAQRPVECGVGDSLDASSPAVPLEVESMEEMVKGILDAWLAKISALGDVDDEMGQEDL